MSIEGEGIFKYHYWILAETEDFSFAYLKELFLSSKMRWIANPQQGTMGEVMSGQVSKLREQMVSAELFMAPNPEDQQEMPTQFGSMMRVGWRQT